MMKPGMAHRGTFVGTPLYAAPEMLSNNTSGPFTDLWALGVIIFQLLTGEVPWKGQKDFIIFKEILDRRIEFPNNMPLEAVDLIDNLLQLNPLNRLGMNGYEAVKQHQFFKGLNFERIKEKLIAPPIPVDQFKNAMEKHEEEKNSKSQ